MNHPATFRAMVPVMLLCVALLLWALWPQDPYGYCILVCWICCSAFAYIATSYLHSGGTLYAWVFCTAEGIYNPVFRVHLNRRIWSVHNVVTIILLVVSAVEDFKGNNKLNSEQSLGDYLGSGREKYVICAKILLNPPSRMGLC